MYEKLERIGVFSCLLIQIFEQRKQQHVLFSQRHLHVGDQNMAAKTAKAQMGEKLKAYIEANYGNIDAWITSMIESVIYNLKNKKAA